MSTQSCLDEEVDQQVWHRQEFDNQNDSVQFSLLKEMKFHSREHCCRPSSTELSWTAVLFASASWCHRRRKYRAFVRPITFQSQRYESI